MHHLHPRSRSTSYLFTTTLAISFLVVAAPHLLPCPVDRRQFADSFETPDGKRYRRKRKGPMYEVVEDQNVAQLAQEDATQDTRPKRECPVPKPGGIVGHIMGFQKEERVGPTQIVVRPLNTTKAREDRKGTNDTR